ncbi:MAG: Ig-like domain-containing protein, partial [Stenotrophomonas sp.]
MAQFLGAQGSWDGIEKYSTESAFLGVSPAAVSLNKSTTKVDHQMAAILSVLNGGSVAQNLVLQEADAGSTPSIHALAGGRYILAGADGRGAADGMIIKRLANNLLLAEESGGSARDVLIIEGFFVNHAQLFGLCTDGNYQPYRLVTEASAAEVAGGVLLQRASTPATAVPSSLLFAVDGSALSPAIGVEPASPMVAASVVPGVEPVGVAQVGFAAGMAAAEALPAKPLVDIERVHDAAESNGVTPVDVFEVADGYRREAATAGGGSDAVEALDVSEAAAFGPTLEAAIDSILDGQGAIQGNIPNGGFTDDGSPKIVGKAESGVLVHIYNGAELIGVVAAGADGAWSFVPRLPMADGRHVISVMYEYGDDEYSDVSAPYVIFVDKIAPDTPVIIGMTDDEGRIQGQIGNGSITDDNRPVIDGRAEPNATVIIYDKGVEVGRAPVAGDGKWSFSPSGGFEDGLHILDYVVVDRAGNTSEKSSTTEFLVDTRPELVEIYAAEDDAGVVKGTFMSGGVSDDTQPRLFGTATAGGTVKIYEGTLLLGETTAGADGKWEYTPAVGLSEGAHSLVATVTTAAKGESDRSATFDFVVDITAPDKPTIEQVYDDRGTLQSALGQGQSTDDSTPTISGKAEAGSTIRV